MRYHNPNKLTVISIFSGCGGLDLGFEQEDYEIKLAVDNFSAAIKTFNQNLSPLAVECDVTKDIYLDLLRNTITSDVVIGGFPCQGFSKAGPKKADDPRNNLYQAMVEAVRILKPRIFLAENVDGLKQNFNGKYVEKICNDFGEFGYDVHVKIINAVGFGLPQHRRRIFFIGVSDGISWVWPKYTHYFETRNGEKNYDSLSFQEATDLKPPHTIRNAIHDLASVPLGEIPDHEVHTWPEDISKIMANIGHGQKLCNVRFAETSVFTWQIPEVFGEVSDDEKKILLTIAKNRRHKIYGTRLNGNPLPKEEIERLSGLTKIQKQVERLVDKGYLKTVDHGYDLKGAMFCSGLFKRPSWDAPSPTILTNFHNPRYFIHPRLNRPFTARECARLQGFPDNFIFMGKTLEKYNQIGNAVPPPLAKILANQIKKAIFGELDAVEINDSIEGNCHQLKLGYKDQSTDLVI